MKNESCVRWKSWDCGPYCFHYWSLCNDSALSTSDSFSVSLAHYQHCRPMNSIISFSSAFSPFCYYSILSSFQSWLPASLTSCVKGWTLSNYFNLLPSSLLYELMIFFLPRIKNAKASFCSSNFFKPPNSWGFCNPFSFSLTLVVREPHTHLDSGDSNFIFGFTSEQKISSFSLI